VVHTTADIFLKGTSVPVETMVIVTTQVSVGTATLIHVMKNVLILAYLIVYEMPSVNLIIATVGF